MILRVMGQPLVFHLILFLNLLGFGLLFGAGNLWIALVRRGNVFSMSLHFCIGVAALFLAFHSLLLLLAKSRTASQLLVSLFASSGLFALVLVGINLYAAIAVGGVPLLGPNGYAIGIFSCWPMFNLVYFNQRDVEEFIELRYASGRPGGRQKKAGPCGTGLAEGDRDSGYSTVQVLPELNSFSRLGGLFSLAASSWDFTAL